VAVAARVTDAGYGALAVMGPEGRITNFPTTGISRAQRRAIGSLPSRRGLLGAVIHDGRPFRLPRIADDPRSVGFPPHHPPMSSFLGAHVKARGSVLGNIYLTEKKGGADFTQQDEDDLVVLAAQAGVAVVNATLYEEVRRHESWLEALRRTNLAILGAMPIEPVLQLICRLAREMALGDLAKVVTVDGRGGLVVAAADGARSASVLRRELPIEGSFAGLVIRTGTPLVLADARRDGRAHMPIVRLGRLGPCIFAPLTAAGAAFAALVVSGRVGADPFSASAVSLVETFAEQVSVALGYEHARREAERLAVLDERERIAQELHDDVAQSLFGVSMALQGTTALVAGTPPEGRLEEAVDQIDRVIRDLRSHIFALRPDTAAGP